MLAFDEPSGGLVEGFSPFLPWYGGGDISGTFLDASIGGSSLADLIGRYGILGLPLECGYFDPTAYRSDLEEQAIDYPSPPPDVPSSANGAGNSLVLTGQSQDASPSLAGFGSSWWILAACAAMLLLWRK